MNTQKEIIDYLKTHELINTHRMCRIADIDSSNFKANLKKGKILEKHIERISKVLADYGLSKYTTDNGSEVSEMHLEEYEEPQYIEEPDFIESKGLTPFQYKGIIEEEFDYDELIILKNKILADKSLTYTTKPPLMTLLNSKILPIEKAMNKK